jgi:glycosyltransferase involved in cell wall biosynthesis
VQTLRIAIVNRTKITGGKGVHAMELASHLHRLGNEVFIVPRYVGHLSIFRYLIRFSKGYDIIHLHELDPEAVFACYFASCLFRSRGVLTIHQFGETSIPKGLFARRIIVHCLKHLDTVICVSNYIASEYLRIVGSGGTVPVVIYNGVNVRLFDPLTDAGYVRSKENLDGKKVILFVGRLIEKKGIGYLLQAFSMLRLRMNHLALVICGDGPMKRYLQSRVKEMKLDKEVIFPGFISNHLLPFYYAAADVCVFPSLSEAFGIVIIEAMSMEKPVLASAVGGIIEIIQDGHNGLLVPSGDVERLFASLERLLKERSFSRRLGFQGRKTVVEKFTIERMIRETLDAYRLALRKPSRFGIVRQIGV